MKIAVVEDDINMRKSLELALSEYSEFEIVTFKNAREALKKIDATFEMVITDINMPGIDGIEFIKKLEGDYEVIVITGNATLNRAIEAIRLGVKDFLTKPFEIDTLIKAIKRGAKARKQRDILPKKRANQDLKSDIFWGMSKKLEAILKVAKKAALSDASIMLLGESGVGKELFAKYIHQNSKRKDKPFIAINMAAIPENLLESELFGYEKGAFTDATTQKKGFFELADKGTIFLDELAEMPLSLQPKILRALQEKEIVRVGGNKPVKIDIRVVSATNADIKERIKEKKFRDDLYYRLNTIPLNIPPLRERKEEIETIAKRALDEICKKYDFDKKEFSKEALDELQRYSWPGNIRELISVVERATILSENGIITKYDLFLEGRK